MNNSTLNILLNEYRKKRLLAEKIADEKKQELYEEFPELNEIDKKLSSLALGTMKEVAKNNNLLLLEKLNYQFIQPDDVELTKENILGGKK